MLITFWMSLAHSMYLDKIFNTNELLHKYPESTQEIETNSKKADRTALFKVNNPSTSERNMEEKEIENEIISKFARLKEADKVYRISQGLRELAKHELKKAIEKRERIRNSAYRKAVNS